MKKMILLFGLIPVPFLLVFGQDTTTVDPELPGWVLSAAEFIGIAIIIIEAIARAVPNKRAKFIIGWVIDFLKWLDEKLNADENTYKKK